MCALFFFVSEFKLVFRTGAGPGAPSRSIGQQLLPSDGLNGPRVDAYGNLWDRYYGGTETSELVWWMTQMQSGLNPIEQERTVLKPGLYRSYPANVDGEHGAAVADVDAAGMDAITRGADDKLWIVEFYSDRCPHCLQLLPEVVKAAVQLKQALGRAEIGFAAINARVFFEQSQLWGVTGLPWVTAWYARAAHGHDRGSRFFFRIWKCWTYRRCDLKQETRISRGPCQGTEAPSWTTWRD